MGVFDRFFKREEVITEDEVRDLLLKSLLGEDETITREKALEIPVVSSCVDMICNTFAMIPFKLYKEEEKDGKKVTQEVDDARVDIINYDTKDKLDGFQFKKAICEDYLLEKGGYAYIDKKDNKFLGLFYVEAKNVAINKNANSIFKKYDFMVDAKTYKDYQFIKLLRNSKDGASGKGLTKEISTALTTAYKRLLYDYDLAVTGGSRKGFIKTNKKLDKAGIEALKTAWEQYYKGTANTVVLNDGMEFQEASNTSRENEINEKNVTFINEIKDIFHMGTSYDDFIKNAVMPIATAFATALNREFLLETEKEHYYFAPDTKELLKGSLKERYEAYQIAITNGFKTRNEIRYMEDDDALEGLDMINLGLGSVLLNPETGEIYTPNTNKIVKMGEETMETEENPQETVDNVENPPNLDENEPNKEDLDEKDTNTSEKDKSAENEEKKPKKGGV